MKCNTLHSDTEKKREQKSLPLTAKYLQKFWLKTNRETTTTNNEKKQT